MFPDPIRRVHPILGSAVCNSARPCHPSRRRHPKHGRHLPSRGKIIVYIPPKDLFSIKSPFSPSLLPSGARSSEYAPSLFMFDEIYVSSPRALSIHLLKLHPSIPRGIGPSNVYWISLLVKSVGV